ncbi:MAG: DoxX family protein, partial [Solirubrobacteraceae bacterium]
LEVAGAAGVLLGLAVTALGAVAAVALMLLMVAALTNHRRVSDPAVQMAPATVLGLLSAVTAVLYLAH